MHDQNHFKNTHHNYIFQHYSPVYNWQVLRVLLVVHILLHTMWDIQPHMSSLCQLWIFLVICHQFLQQQTRLLLGPVKIFGRSTWQGLVQLISVQALDSVSCCSRSITTVWLRAARWSSGELWEILWSKLQLSNWILHSSWHLQTMSGITSNLYLEERYYCSYNLFQGH